MDIQETIDSIRAVLEGVIAPSIKDLRTRLDTIEKDVQNNGRGFAGDGSDLSPCSP